MRIEDESPKRTILNPRSQFSIHAKRVRYSRAVVRLAVEAILALLLFGCIPVVVKSIGANPATIGIFRLALATTGVAGLMAVRGELRRIAVRDAGRLAVIGILFFGHWWTFFLAIKISSASIAAIGLSTYGVLLLVLGSAFRHDRATATDAVAVVAAAAGAILVVPEFELSNRIAAGMLLSVLSALFYATLPLLHQRWSHIGTTTRALGQFGFALCCFLLLWSRTDWQLSGRDWLGLLFLGVGATLIGHSLWVRVTTRIPASLTSIIYYGNIPVAVALSVVLLGEPLAPRTAGGAALIIGGGLFGLAAKVRYRARVLQERP